MSMVKPVLILGTLAGVALYAVSSSAKPAPLPPPAPPAVILDANLPPALRGQVLSALATVTHVPTLETFANTIAPAFPIAAAQLRVKAQTLRAAMGSGEAPQGSAAVPAGGGAPPPAPAPPAPSEPPPIQVLPQGASGELSDPLQRQVTEQLTSGTDANALESLATAVESTHPVLAAMLRGRAALVRTVQSAAAAVSRATPAAPPPPAPAAPYVPAPYIPSIPQGDAAAVPASLPPAPVEAPPPPPPMGAPPAPPLAPALPGGAMWGAGIVPGLDVGMPPEVTERVLRAIATETNPDTLRGLGNELAARGFPIASALVLAKANSLALLTLSTPAAAPPPPAPPVAQPAAPPPPAPPPMRPATAPIPSARPTGGPTYVVQQNDFPIKIAKKYGQPEHAWPELVAANPHKATLADGNFKSLQPGETINIPPAWRAQRAPALPSAEPALRGGARPGALDPNLPGELAAAVMNALSTATDPVELRSFASSIMQQYPVAAAVLMAKAAALQAGLSQAVPAALRVPAPNAAPPPMPASPGSPPRYAAPAPAQAQDGGTYTVIAGDSPIRIAKKFGQTERAWPELVAANPHKATRPDGNFKSLQPGEKLKIPAAWARPATRVAGEDESPSWATGAEGDDAPSWATGAEGDDAPSWATGAEGDTCGPTNVAGEDDYAPAT